MVWLLLLMMLVSALGGAAVMGMILLDILYKREGSDKNG